MCTSSKADSPWGQYSIGLEYFLYLLIELFPVTTNIPRNNYIKNLSPLNMFMQRNHCKKDLICSNIKNWPASFGSPYFWFFSTQFSIHLLLLLIKYGLNRINQIYQRAFDPNKWLQNGGMEPP